MKERNSYRASGLNRVDTVEHATCHGNIVSTWWIALSRTGNFFSVITPMLGLLSHHKQVYNSTATQISAYLLSLSVMSLLLPVSEFSFSNVDSPCLRSANRDADGFPCLVERQRSRRRANA